MIFSADGLGFSASLLCAVHCALLPTLVSMLPLVGLEFLAHHAVEGAIVCLSIVVGVVALLPGYARVHGKILPILVFLCGMGLIALGHWLMPEIFHLPFVVMGATTVAMGHLINWRLSHPKEAR